MINFEKDLSDKVIGNTTEYHQSVKFVIYSNHAPIIRNKISYKGLDYEVDSVLDVTTEEEQEEGLSYTEVEMYLL
jgi:hypothetical protein